MGSDVEKPKKIIVEKSKKKSYENEYLFDNEMLIEWSGEILNLININNIAKSTCIIEYNNNNKRIKGTGFLLELPFPNSNEPMKGLMTNNHILDHKILLKNEISLNFDLENKTFNLYAKDHSIFSDPFLDVTFIQLKDEELKDLGIDCLEIHEEKSITTGAFIVQYPKGKNISIAQGKIKGRWGFNLFHTVSTDHGSSGGPLVLINSNKIIGIHKSGMKELKCNAATNIQTIVEALRVIYYSKINNKLSIIKRARTPLTDEEINELKNYGLIETNSPYIFISPRSEGVTPLWFYRTNHAWYWAPTEPKLGDIYTSNWLIIYPGGSLKVIGGFWNGKKPAKRNIVLIHWLESNWIKILDIIIFY